MNTNNTFIKIFSFFLLSLNPLALQANYLPVASYKINASLNDKEKIISGQEKITFTNTSEKEIDTLYLHLYANAFSSDSTFFVKDSRSLKELMQKEEYRGFIQVKNVKSPPGELNWEVAETQMKIFLPQSLKPGKEIEIGLEFELKLPKIISRLGYYKDSYLLSEWFPKMAVLEKNGIWSTFSYHRFTEFYSDFGSYDVSITLPLKYIVDGTGYIVSQKENPDSTKTVTFKAEKVHDFAFCASPEFRIGKENIEGIEVIFLLLPQNSYKYQRWVKAAEVALRYCNSHFGKYPYGKLVISNSYIGVIGAAMECPMLVTMPIRLPLTPRNIRLAEEILIHEIVHQWWYGVVASNEALEAWLDEGFTTYTTRKIMEKEYGPKGSLIDLWGLKLSDLNLAKWIYLKYPALDPVVQPSWKFLSSTSYGVNVYYKASLVLELLGNLIGEEKMNALLREYYDLYRFQHPKTADFIKLTEEVTGRNLDGFFEDWLYSTKTCDYEIGRIKSELKESSGKEKLYEATVELIRNGDIIMPEDILLELENGEKILKSWDGKDRWFKLQLETNAKIKSALLDPQNKMVLDTDVNNNGLSNKPYSWPVFKFFSDCLFWMESAVQWLMDVF